jgi:hypothetical protein
MDFYELILRLSLALGVGLLFGLERARRAREERPQSIPRNQCKLRPRSSHLLRYVKYR